MNSGKKILISPLDWGLGHTTRIIPVINILLKKGHSVTVAANEAQQQVLREFYPNLKYVFLEGYNIEYSLNESMAWSMIKQSGKIVASIKRENQWLAEYVNKNPQDILISDNRFGFYHPRIESIYITHQINIQGPSLIKPLLYGLHKSYIDNFHHCWIPDTEKNDLAGELSRTQSQRFQFIGPISRFTKAAENAPIEYDYLGIVSGPEPQRSVFCKLLEEQFFASEKKCAIIGGLPLEKKNSQNQNVSYFSHLNTTDFYNLVSKSGICISRSGYSTIMDFAILQKPIFFVPTPGQTEQEYLAQLHYRNAHVGYCKQSEFDLKKVHEANCLPNVSSINWFDQAAEKIAYF